MARGSCGRDGPVVAGCFFPHLHRVALAAGAFALALAAKICGDRRLRVADHTAPALWHEPLQLSPSHWLSSPGPVTGFGSVRIHIPAGTAGSNAVIPATAVIASTQARLITISPYLAITTEHHGQRSVLRLQGELDACNQDHLRRAISSVLEGPPRTLVLDLSALRFTDCAGLSALVWAHKRLAEQGHELVITGAQPLIQRVLCLTGLDTYLHLSASDA